MIAREPVFAALWELLLTVPPPPGMQWQIRGRRVIHWSQCTQQPALFLQEQHQVTKQPTFGLPQWEWNAVVWIYFRTDISLDQNSIPDQMINTLVDNVEATIRTYPLDIPLQTLGPPMDPPQTLGGVPGVLHCYINGTVAFDAGVVDKQAVIAIPIVIIVGA